MRYITKVQPTNGTHESIGKIGSITERSKEPIMWLIMEYGKAIARINVIIVYQKIRLPSLSRQWGCHMLQGRLNMALRIVLTIHAIGEPQLGQALHPG